MSLSVADEGKFPRVPMEVRNAIHSRIINAINSRSLGDTLRAYSDHFAQCVLIRRGVPFGKGTIFRTKRGCQ